MHDARRPYPPDLSQFLPARRPLAVLRHPTCEGHCMISAISTLDLTRDRFMYDVIDGLSRPWKRLPPKYFYDEAGSRLFDRITGLDEYYLTRSELAIMDCHATEIAAHCGPRTLLIEPGAGNLTKVRRLLNHLPEREVEEYLAKATADDEMVKRLQEQVGVGPVT